MFLLYPIFYTYFEYIFLSSYHLSLLFYQGLNKEELIVKENRKDLKGKGGRL